MGILALLVVGGAAGAAVHGQGQLAVRQLSYEGSIWAGAGGGSMLLSWNPSDRGLTSLVFSAEALEWSRVGVEETSVTFQGRDVVHADHAPYEQRGTLAGAQVALAAARPGAFLLWVAPRDSPAAAVAATAHGAGRLMPLADAPVAEIARFERSAGSEDPIGFRHGEPGPVVRLELPPGHAAASGDALVVLWGLEARLAGASGDAVDLATGHTQRRGADGATTTHAWEYAVLRVRGAQASLADPRFAITLVSPAVEASLDGRAVAEAARGDLGLDGLRWVLGGAGPAVLDGSLRLAAAAPGDGLLHLGLEGAWSPATLPAPLTAAAVAPASTAGPGASLLPLGLALAALGAGGAGLWAARDRLPLRGRVHARATAKALALREAADALLQAGKPREAITWYDAALRRRPRDAAALAGKGACLLAEERLEEALACFQAALALHPADASVSYACASICARLGRHDEARAWLLKAAELSPERARQALRDPAFVRVRAGRDFGPVARLLGPVRGADESMAYH